MADNLSAGNPRAHAIRVHFVDTSTLIQEGMPVCYNFDTTTNWFGGSVSDGAVTASTTLTAGSPDTAQAKYLEVELPSATNIQWFAGVVKKGGWVGKTTSGTSGVGQILDIYTPNGAIVPVRTDQTCLIGQTILAITTGQSELGVPLSTDSRPVAISEETVDRETAGLVLAKLDVNLFLYQDHAGTPLSVDDADTTTGTQINHSNIKFLGSSIYNRALYMIGELAGGGAGLNGMFKFRTYVSSQMTSLVQVVCGNLHVKDAGTLVSGSGEFNSAFYATVETEGAGGAASSDFSNQDICAYQAVYYVDEGGGAPDKAYVLGIPDGSPAGAYDWDGLLWTQSAAALGIVTCTGASEWGIPIMINATEYWIQVRSART